MLHTFYNNFGFLGSISIAFIIFITFIFWLAGVAGISQLKSSTTKKIKLFFSIVFPPYPVIWLLWDIYSQNQFMKEETVE